jgi:hypothetical protein
MALFLPTSNNALGESADALARTRKLATACAAGIRTSAFACDVRSSAEDRTVNRVNLVDASFSEPRRMGCRRRG